MRKIVLFLIFLVFSIENSFSSPWRLDSNWCHTDRKTWVYHCHRYWNYNQYSNYSNSNYYWNNYSEYDNYYYDVRRNYYDNDNDSYEVDIWKNKESNIKNVDIWEFDEKDWKVILNDKSNSENNKWVEFVKWSEKIENSEKKESENTDIQKENSSSKENENKKDSDKSIFGINYFFIQTIILWYLVYIENKEKNDNS